MLFHIYVDFLFPLVVNHKQFYCDECGKFFKKRGGLSMHKKSHAKGLCLNVLL